MPYQNINDLEDFQDALDTTKLVVVDFWASWCGPCKKIAPVFEELSDEYTNVVFIKVQTDDDEGMEISDEYSVSALPTFKFFLNKKEYTSIQGADENSLRLQVQLLSSLSQ